MKLQLQSWCRESVCRGGSVPVNGYIDGRSVACAPTPMTRHGVMRSCAKPEQAPSSAQPSLATRYRKQVRVSGPMPSRPHVRPDRARAQNQLKNRAHAGHVSSQEHSRPWRRTMTGRRRHRSQSSRANRLGIADAALRRARKNRAAAGHVSRYVLLAWIGRAAGSA